MYGECHAHIFMNGYHYRKAVELHKNHINEQNIREWFTEYEKRGVAFIRDGGDALGVSAYARQIAGEYGITYCTPLFAIHKNGHYGGIVGVGFDTMREYRGLVAEVKRRKGDFIKIMAAGIMDFNQFGVITGEPLGQSEIREMIHIAHEEGFAVMVHGNTAQAVRDAAFAGADSIEHGNYLDRDCIQALADSGVCCGVCLFAASNFQQFGIRYTTVGKAGFITACYIVIVPVIGIFLKKACGRLLWVSVAMAVVGLYFLCMTESLTVGKGDFLVFICALLFSLHILVIDYFSPRTDGVKMSCIQFFVCGILSGIAMLFTEEPHLADIFAAWIPILYAGIMSCGVAYTLQIVGQKGMNPTVASLILSLESCISVLAGWAILGQKLSVRELSGCLIMFGAIILAQLPGKQEKSSTDL